MHLTYIAIAAKIPYCFANYENNHDALSRSCVHLKIFSFVFRWIYVCFETTHKMFRYLTAYSRANSMLQRGNDACWCRLMHKQANGQLREHYICLNAEIVCQADKHILMHERQQAVSKGSRNILCLERPCGHQILTEVNQIVQGPWKEDLRYFWNSKVKPLVSKRKRQQMIHAFAYRAVCWSNCCTILRQGSRNDSILS